MKFVNKLSVISLIVLMFSFMNVASAADACTRAAVNACSQIKDQSTCANYYMKTRDGGGYNCIWDTQCTNSGVQCGNKNCPSGQLWSTEGKYCYTPNR